MSAEVIGLVVRDGRTLCRSCSGEKYFVPVSRIVLAFLLLSLSSVAFAQQQQRNNERPAACDQYDKLQVPASDLPTPDERKALASCNSEHLYLGIGHPADPVKARKCAYIEREAGKGIPEVVFGAAGMLTMIYANGKGAARNFDLALKFACEFDSPPENDLRFEHLLKLKNENWTGDDFNLCDDQRGSEFWLRACLKPESDKEQAVRTHKVSAITKKWTAAEKTAFRELQKAATASFEASALNEVDLEGEIGRAIDREVAETSLNDGFVIDLQQFEAGRLPEFTALEFSKADAELNSIYSKIQSDPKNNIEEGTSVTPEGVKIAQRAWLRYREAWVKFGHVKYPSVTPESWKTWLTQERVEILKNLRGDPAP
jgi:hypothetical protein